MSIDIRIPGRVYDDYLNPNCTEMEEALGLPQPRCITRGRGFSALYRDVTTEQVEDLAGYLRDRGETLLMQGVTDPYDPFEKAEMATHREAIRIAKNLSCQG